MKTSFKRAVCFLLVLVLVVFMSACSSGSNEKAPEGGSSAGDLPGGVPAGGPGKDDGVLRLGASFAQIGSQAMQVMAAEFERYGKEAGFDEVIILSAENQVERQIDQIQDLITQKCDVIVCHSSDPDGIIPVIERVNDAQIPVIAIDRKINGGDIYFAIETDNVAAGRNAALQFGLDTRNEPEGSVEVLHLIGNQSSSALRERHAGFEDEVSNWPQLKIIAEPYIQNDADKAYNAVVDAFKTNPDIRAIFTSADNFVAPIISALKEIDRLKPKGEAGHVMISSVDGATLCLESLTKGENDSVICQMFIEMTQEAIDIAKQYTDGEYIKPGKITLMPTIIATKENVESLSKQGKLWGLPNK